MKAIAKNLWAPVVTPLRGKAWIDWTCVCCTRAQAKRAYIDGVDVAHIKRHLEGVKFVKVYVATVDAKGQP